MIATLKGSIEEKRPTDLVIDVNGVGYQVFIPLSSYDRLPARGEVCKLLIYDHIREDAHHLYGFMSEGERRLFRLLMSISGIGPKLALSALSGLSVRELRAAVVGGDVKRLSSISGVGKKMAERLIVELRDKLSAGEALEAVAGEGEASPEELKFRDAMLALVSLGYKQDSARKMVLEATKKHADAGPLSVEDVIRLSLAG
ncbi:MAG: Holliday junction branch migration protein RuvA [Verrucomicrobia bacterium]|nr:Holliday junction branch migration protein RuvA [Verrucomicrobiota bacterium]